MLCSHNVLKRSSSLEKQRPVNFIWYALNLYINLEFSRFLTFLSVLSCPGLLSLLMSLLPGEHSATGWPWAVWEEQGYPDLMCLGGLRGSSCAEHQVCGQGTHQGCLGLPEESGWSIRCTKSEKVKSMLMAGKPREEEGLVGRK